VPRTDRQVLIGQRSAKSSLGVGENVRGFTEGFDAETLCPCLFATRTEPRSFCPLRPTTTVNLLRLLELPATLTSAQMENATPPAMESSHTSRKPGVVLKIMVTAVVVFVDDLGSASHPRAPQARCRDTLREVHGHLTPRGSPQCRFPYAAPNWPDSLLGRWCCSQSSQSVAECGVLRLNR
jgi:hypothetical protein